MVWVELEVEVVTSVDNNSNIKIINNLEYIKNVKGKWVRNISHPLVIKLYEKYKSINKISKETHIIFRNIQSTT
jgi:hypothetical protein